MGTGLLLCYLCIKVGSFYYRSTLYTAIPVRIDPSGSCLIFVFRPSALTDPKEDLPLSLQNTLQDKIVKHFLRLKPLNQMHKNIKLKFIKLFIKIGKFLFKWTYLSSLMKMLWKTLLKVTYEKFLRVLSSIEMQEYWVWYIIVF